MVDDAVRRGRAGHARRRLHRCRDGGCRGRRLLPLRQSPTVDDLSRPRAVRAFERRHHPTRRHHQGWQRSGQAGSDRGAWTYRMQARVSKLHDRNERLPQAIRDIAWTAQVRLCARYRRLSAAGKPKVIVTTAIAREMVGFLWAITRQVQLSGRSPERTLLDHIWCPGQEAGCRGESSWPVMSRHCRRSLLDRGSPKTKPRSCRSQPAHESLINRRLWPCLLPWAPSKSSVRTLSRKRFRLIEPLDSNMRTGR